MAIEPSPGSAHGGTEDVIKIIAQGDGNVAIPGQPGVKLGDDAETSGWESFADTPVA